jgi:hypothetical protein
VKVRNSNQHGGYDPRLVPTVGFLLRGAPSGPTFIPRVSRQFFKKAPNRPASSTPGLKNQPVRMPPPPTPTATSTRGC